MKYFVLVLITVFSTIHHVKCADELPPDDALFQSVKDHYAAIAEAEAKEYRADWKQDRWADYMPSVGIAYTPSGAPRPGVSFSLASLMATRKKKREHERIERRIYEVYQLKAEAEIRVIKSELEMIEEKEKGRSLAAELLEIEKLIFEIAEDEYNRAELDPKGYLSAKRKWLIVQSDYHREEAEIEKMKRGVLVAAYWK